MSDLRPDESIAGRTIAVVSGKGGSGKTLISAQIAMIVAGTSTPVTLMDADVGTAGLTYYLGLRQVRNTRAGLSSLVGAGSNESARLLLQSTGKKRLSFLAIGDHRRLARMFSVPNGDEQLRDLVAIAVRDLAAISKDVDADHTLIVDCRGGIDDESIAVCEIVDDIMLVVEPDTTSFQASRHLVDVLSDADLAHKIRGFIINKVYADPSAVVRSGAAEFGARCLVSVPFDVDAARAFLVGDLPSETGAFDTHIREALSLAYPASVSAPSGRIWTGEDFDNFAITSPDGNWSRVLFIALMLSTGTVAVLAALLFQSTKPEIAISVGLCVVFGLLASLDPLRRMLGRRLFGSRRSR